MTWDEVGDVEPHDFTLATVPERFGRLGDLHASIDDVAFRLDTLLEWAERDEKDDPSGVSQDEGAEHGGSGPSRTR